MTTLSLFLFGLALAMASAFTSPAASVLRALHPSSSSSPPSSTAIFAYPDVLVVGPSMLQLVVAKHLSQRSDFTPMVVAPQKTIDSYQKLVNDPSDQILKDALIGLPEEVRAREAGGDDARCLVSFSLMFTNHIPLSFSTV